MRKNKALRIASILMVVCLVATCAICGTMAKYTTNGEGTATGNVAKWGIDIGTIDLGDLFKTQASESLVAQGKMAPGTSGSDSFRIDGDGTPEVKYQVNASITLTDSEGQAVPDALKNNVVWTLTSGPQTLVTGNFAALQTYIAGLQKTYAVGEKFPLAGLACTLAWNWPFETGTTPAEIEAADELDTAAGNAATEVKLVLTVGATQLNS